MDRLTEAFLAKSFAELDGMDRGLTDPGRRRADAGLAGEIFRAVHTIRGATGFPGYERLERLVRSTRVPRESSGTTPETMSGTKEEVGMRTLIVDDSRFIRKYLKEHLQRLGVDCAEAGHGGEALEALRGRGRFDLMLIDMNMPEMNGLECIRQVRKERIDPEMKVMMVTTEADHRVIEEALALGADEFLMKPFTGQSLQEKLMLLGFAMAA